jgi:hypothetical protein
VWLVLLVLRSVVDLGGGWRVGFGLVVAFAVVGVGLWLAELALLLVLPTRTVAAMVGALAFLQGLRRYFLLPLGSSFGLVPR